MLERISQPEGSSDAAYAFTPAPVEAPDAYGNR